MKRPAIFFDRDNTLIVADGYLGDPERVVLVAGAADAIARARQLGYATVTVSNQSGVARGMFDEAQVNAVNERLDRLLGEQNPAAVIDRHEFCPYHPEAKIEQYRQESDLRKPKPGMILRAAQKLNLELPQSWMIGDAKGDIEAGRAAGCRTILFHDPDLAPSPAAQNAAEAGADFTVSTLKEALDVIENTSPADVKTETPPAPLDPVEAEAALQVRPTDFAPGQTPGAPSIAPAPKPLRSDRVEALLEQILHEVRRGNEHTHTDFSVSKLLAGIVQILALAALFFAYISRGKDVGSVLLFALVLQTLTIALLIMGRQK